MNETSLRPGQVNSSSIDQQVVPADLFSLDPITSELGLKEEWQFASKRTSRVVSYDLSSTDATMLEGECLSDVIELSGTLTANRTFNFYLDTTRLYGRKAYKVLVSAISNSTTTRTITLSGSGSVDVSIPVKSDSLPQIHEIYIDASGNVKSGLEGYTIIEEGSNSNGSWIKFSNGVMVCWGVITMSTQLIDTDCYTTWTFPASFRSTLNLCIQRTPLYQGDGSGSESYIGEREYNGVYIILVNPTYLTVMSYSYKHAIGQSTTYSMCVTGRWR